MSISATLNNALSGLVAASRSAQVVSDNVANALTDGYARREIELSARVGDGSGAGVQFDGLTRIVDETAIRERRLAAASVGAAEIEADFQSSMLALIGQPEEASSLSDRVVAFETALLEAASRPGSDARLANVLQTATSLADKLNGISDAIQTVRQDTDAAIDLEVRR